MFNKSICSFLIVSIICFSCYSCKKKRLTARDFASYIEDEANGLKVSKNIGEIVYHVQYKPVEYIIVREKGDFIENQKRKEELSGMQYYTISYSLTNSSQDILKTNISSSEDYYERVNYFSFGFQKEIYLVDGNDTLDCKLFNYVRSYGLSPRADFVIGFDKKKENKIEDKLIVFEDQIFGGGIIKIKIEKVDIENIPELI